MVRLTAQPDAFVFEILGLRKLWAFKSRIIVPRHCVLLAYHDPQAWDRSRGWRIGGTHIPGWLTTGRYHEFAWGGRPKCYTFWDLTRCGAARALVVELQNHKYDRLIVEIDDVDAAVKLLQPGP